MGAHTTGKECDGCGRKKGQVEFKVYKREIPGFGKAISFTFCATCERLDREGLRPPIPPPTPTPQALVNQRPRPPRLRGPPALLPRVTAPDSF